MGWRISGSFLILVIWNCIGRGEGYMVNNNPYNRVENLDPRGAYQLEWLVDWNEKRVTFNVTVATRGYVGFGLSRNGKMSGADIVIGGVFPNRTTYFADRHAVGNHIPDMDPSQDWKLHSAWENRSHTFLSFSRLFDSCDLQDYPITENRVAVIWAYGETDNDIIYHHQNRGVYNVYLLQPDYSPQIVHSSSNKVPQVVGAENKDLKVWSIPTEIRLASQDTTYWCTMHKAPKLGRKHHVIGFETIFADEVSESHVHHFFVGKCKPPPGYSASSLFAPFVGHRGQECIGLLNPIGPMPIEYCSQTYQARGVGGRVFFHPPHVGQAFGESDDEYYMVQIHYDNPNLLDNIVVDMRLDLYYTEKLRPLESGMMQLRTPSPGLTPSILIPPSTLAQTVYSYCGPQCTQRMFPKDGITIYALLLHSHNSGRQIRLQHFRKNKELPWISSDDNYAFDYQQFRVIPKERQVLPGDQLTIRCVYDNTWTNGTVVGGFSSRQEMCLVFIFYYSEVTGYRQCGSEIVSGEARERILGMSNVTWSSADFEFAADPASPHAGRTVSQVSDNHVIWDLRRRAELQRLHLEHPQVGTCYKLLSTADSPPRSFPKDNQGILQNPADDFSEIVKYPFAARPYQPKATCG